MNLTELRKEIEKIQHKVIKSSQEIMKFTEVEKRLWVGYKAQLQGIKQTVEAVDKFMFLSREPDYDNFREWQKIKELLSLNDRRRGDK